MSIDVPLREMEAPRAEGIRAIKLELELLSGEKRRGTIYALLPPAGSRALDYLNRTPNSFISLWEGDGVTLVNTDYVVQAVERIEA